VDSLHSQSLLIENRLKVMIAKEGFQVMLSLFQMYPLPMNPTPLSVIGHMLHYCSGMCM
jgi:hypothetical protein